MSAAGPAMTYGEIAVHDEPSGKVTGIDRGDVHLAASKRRPADSNLPVEFRVGDVRKLDFSDGTFDRIRTDRVVMFVPEIETAIGEMVRVPRPGARIVASELDHEMWCVYSRLPEINRKIREEWGASNPKRCLGRQLRRLFASHGLRDLQAATQVIRAPCQMFLRITGGFLNAALERSE
jgi:ubiquinone/menaquinone biosynthesis C-methylase UbiE